jgi:hypothetical protein
MNDFLIELQRQKELKLKENKIHPGLGNCPIIDVDLETYRNGICIRLFTKSGKKAWSSMTWTELDYGDICRIEEFIERLDILVKHS